MAQIPLASITVPGTPAALLDAMRQFELDAVEGRLTCQRGATFKGKLRAHRMAKDCTPRDSASIRLLPRSGPP